MHARRWIAVSLVALGAACGPEPAGSSGIRLADGRLPDVLLVVVDTLRADHLSLYGYAKPTSPRLDVLARRALVFTHAQTPRDKTAPAVTSLMTGLYPHDHGVRDNGGTRLAPGLPVLAESLRAAGYATAAVVGNFVLQDVRSGLARGFDTWIDELPDAGVPPDGVPQRRAESLTDEALALLDQPRDRPLFLYLHYMDPHGLYDPPAEHRLFGGDAPDPIPAEEELPPDPLHDVRVADYNVPPGCTLPDGRVDAAAVRALYDGEIRYVDAEIGRLLDAVPLDETLVVFAADHGESLGEHRYWFEHGFYAYEATCRVPLLIAGPGIGARRTDAGISLVDVAPTLLDLLGLPPQELVATASPVRGVSRATAEGYHPVFSEKIVAADQPGTVQAKAVRIGDHKLIRRYALDDRHQVRVLSDELYLLSEDPGEAVNLIAGSEGDPVVDRLRAELLRFAAAEVRFADIGRQLLEDQERLRQEDPQAYEVLRQLGYVR